MTLPETQPVFDESFRECFEKLLQWRRDVRHFKTDPVPEDVLNRVLSLADMAPSVGNSQPWRIVQVEGLERRSAVMEAHTAANRAARESYGETEQGKAYRSLKLAGLREAPVHLAVFVDPNPEQGHGLGRATMPETLAYSAVGMIQTLWLAARIEGIGLGWVSILDPIRTSCILDVNPSWSFIAYLCLGYPEKNYDAPELERKRWQARTPLSDRILKR
ncbi:5,6-dimethylbenzimidazole synthase [Roseibium sp. TrichSKD4]|uniref:5,6-dimethylbenzimidazole synthase n=1 Tax=Roseibium sp. TrichSKD4 TaxID=744980 RepID=UPI0003130AF9|nr:5,6-dimethylbenzimidazole synthase [Roseibium sp. TrichSKD4]